jgi:2-polyprenyl-6-methoxyphenol hydroxylase-like FAD-dependent oxidoreductase
MTAAPPRATPSVLIVGAGPTGLALALWLTRLGVGLRIIDRTAEPGTTSRALGVQARTLELYRQVGIADAVTQGGVETAGVNLWVRGARAARLPLRDIGEGLTPFPGVLIFPQDAHERLLIDRLHALGVDVERPTELAGFDQDPDGVHATLRGPDGSEEVCDVAFLAGCDGADSTVRRALGVDFPGGTYSRLFYVADVEANGPAADHELHVDLDEADLLAVFPLKEPGCIRLVGTLRQDMATGDHELSFDDVSDRAIQHLKLAISRVNWFSTYHVHHRVARRFRQGRAFLVGDAAHIHSPVGAQGMNTGIGDAVNLAWKFAAVVGGRAPDSLLDTYETERIGFARRLVGTTDRVFTVVVRQGPLAEQVRTAAFPRVAPLLLRLHALRVWVFRAVSQIGVNYRDSPLSEGAAGPLRGGDRLPWARTGRTGGTSRVGPGEDNFAPLTSLQWQVHIYGEPATGLAERCETLGLPLVAFPWSPDLGRASGLRHGVLYLIRPDGYLALIDEEASPQRLEEYFTRRGLQP